MLYVLMWYFRYFPTSGKDGEARLCHPALQESCGRVDRARVLLDATLSGCGVMSQQDLDFRTDQILWFGRAKMLWLVHPIAMNLGCVVCIQNIYVSLCNIMCIYIYIYIMIYTYCVYVYTFRRQTVHELFHDATDMASPDAWPNPAQEYHAGPELQIPLGRQPLWVLGSESIDWLIH